jgi:multicomponent Na+:H+ antiporter subunit D
VSSIDAHLPVLQVVVPLLVAPLVTILRPSGLAWAASTATSFMALMIAVGLTAGVLDGDIQRYEVGAWAAPYGIELAVDSFGALLLLILTGASTFALLAGKASLDQQIESGRQPLFFSAWLLVLAGLAGILVSADAFNIFVFMEISSLASYVLIAGGPDRRALPAVFKYLMMGTIGATFYLIGIGLIYMMTGTLNLADIQVRLVDVAGLRPVVVAIGFITVGLGLKAAVFPLHVWLPNAYNYAPHAATVLLAACATKVSLYVLLTFDFVVLQPVLPEHDPHFGAFLMPLAVLGILAASAVALFEPNLKRLLAFSSVAQIGYILLGASMVSLPGVTASLMHMFNHALAKGALFLAVMCLATRLPSLELDDLAGAAKRMPWTMAAFVVGGLSLIGIPGTAGFTSKWYLISASLEVGGAGGWLLIGVIVIGSLMAVVYIWRVVEAAWFRVPQAEPTEVREAPALMLSVTWLAAAANVYFGLSPWLQTTLASSGARMLLGDAP